MKVSVSILNEKNNYINAVNKLNNTNADYLHIDVMDNTFTDNSSFSINEVKEICSISNKKIDIHLMSSNLDNILNDYILLNPEIITIHSEINNFDKYINTIKEKNIKVGVAINPDTDINKIKDYLNEIDLVLIMSVNPGMGGQSFIMSTVDKLIKLNNIKSNYLIEVDGGINDQTIKYVKDYVDIVVSGSFITNSDNYQDNIDLLK